MLNRQIENIRNTRVFIINMIKELSIEKLNKVPHGFNNNILWNLGHLVAAQQSICYTKGALQPSIPEHAYQQYKPGTKPEVFFDSDQEDQVKALLISSIITLQRDYESGTFTNFVPWTNRYGNTLNDIDDAIAYLHFHEGLHLGVIGSIKKLVQK